ncbi:TPA: hypothetical protein PGG59_004250 [Raoultella planticola]|nr:hypothetical protein [Raoultella planticola]
MNIETVNELIQSLESAGELSIKEQKYLELAKAHVQLAAENVALKTAHPQPFGQEMMKALDAYEKHQDDVPETGMLDAFFILRDSIRVETPATDRIVSGIKADVLPANIAEIIDSGDLETICYESERSYAEDFRIALYNFRQLREGDK